MNVPAFGHRDGCQQKAAAEMIIKKWENVKKAID